MKSNWLACFLIPLLAACGSDKESTEEASAPAASTTAPAPGKSTASATPDAGDDVSNWNESAPPAATPPSGTEDPLADPAAVIARYKRECSGKRQSPECQAQRLDVETIFLQALLTVRASDQRADPRWYRLAAASETPQLACIGLTELRWDPKRTAEDEALLVRALDSPYHSVRAAAMSGRAKVPGLAEPLKRAVYRDYSALTGVCLDNARDAVVTGKWAGGYPGAQFRFFASNERLRWFTTPDAPEKVFAWFASRGKPARTQEELMADAQAKYMEEMLRLSSNPDEDHTAEMMALMASQGAPAHWGQPFSGMEGIGPIKFVMIGANQAIAIFADDVLKATSIVAVQPPEPVDMNPDIEAAKEEVEMRQILGY